MRIKKFMDERVAVAENSKFLGKALVGSLDGFWRISHWGLKGHMRNSKQYSYCHGLARGPSLEVPNN